MSHVISNPIYIGMTMDRTNIDILWVMLQQEQITYQIMRQHTDCICCDLSQHEESSNCRYNMVDWCYRMIDFCDLNRETVAIAMNFVDRFIVTKQGKAYLMNNTMYQLVAVTALYTAVKVHEVQSIDLQSLSNVSKGIYSLKKIEEVEREIVDALQWRMNPPTAMSFVRGLVELIPFYSKVSAKVKESILKLVRVQTEYAVFDQELIHCKMSTIGYCSLINAFTTIFQDHDMLNHLKCMLAQKLQFQNSDKHESVQVQAKLYLFLSNHQKKNNDCNGTNQFSRIFPQCVLEPDDTSDIPKNMPLCPTACKRITPVIS